MRKAILVLGPPRSGTSLVSHVIHKLGVDFGNQDHFVDTQVHTFNPIFFELQSLNNLNDKIFSYFAKNFSDFDWMPEKSDFDEAVILQFEQKIASFIEEEFPKSYTIGLKDPRFCFTLPLWDAVLKRLGFDVHYVLTRRLSNSVFVSNKGENKYSSEANFRIVSQSTLLARHFVAGKKHVTVRYEDLLANPGPTILRLCNELSLDRALISEARSVIREDLNHQKGMVGSRLYNYFESVIDSLSISSDEYLRYREIFWAATFEKDQRIANLSQVVAEREGQVASLSQVVAEREGQVANLSQVVAEREGQVANLSQVVAELEGQVASLSSQAVAEREGQVASLSQVVAEREGQVASLSQAVAEREGQVASLSQAVEAYQNSKSWRLTKPVRVVLGKMERLASILFRFGALFLNRKALKRMAGDLRRTGLANLEYQLNLLQSEEYANQVSKERGISPEFLRWLITVGNWWFGNSYRREFLESLAAFFRGDVEGARKIARSNLHVHIDKPEKLFHVVANSFVISGWGVDPDARAAAKIRVRIGKTVHQPHWKPREDVQQCFSSICEVPLDTGFAVAPSLSMGLHRMWIDVEGPDSTWIPVRRALLFRVPRLIFELSKQKLSYKAWNRIEQKRLKAELPDIVRHVEVMLHKPIFTVVIDAREGLDGWEKTLKSIRGQIYPKYELCVLVNEGATLPASLEQGAKCLHGISLTDVNGGGIVFIESGQSLSSNALYEFASAINHDPELDLIYGDEDQLRASGERCNPFYKPDWSPDYLETFNYIGFPACFRTTLACVCFNNANLYDLTLRFTERTSKIRHVEKILGHRTERKVDAQTLGRISAQNIAALQGRLTRTGRRGTVREHQVHRGCYNIQLDLKREPLVSIVIPTAAKTVIVEERQVDLITNIVDQIRNLSTYKNIEIIVVDNNDLSERQQLVLTAEGCKRITYTEPVFNIAKKLNLGASLANGELLLLMNDDIEILSPSWIERMIEHFEKPHVGVVGAKLLYPDGRTQHVGVVHNYGNADHVRRLYPRDEAGYYYSTCGVRNYMAVTGAVMMTLANIYREVGGYSEELAVSYNDADFCLKVREKGFYSVYAPEAELIHMESISCTRTADMRELAWYHRRWAFQLASDPYYNEHFLTVAPPTFEPYVNQRLL